VTGDRSDLDLDPDGVPWPEAPMSEPTGGTGNGSNGSNIRRLPRRPDPEAPAGTLGRGLIIEDLAEVIARVDAAGPPAWLIEGLWPADAYGVLAAEDKAGKTWAALDLAVSVAAGHPWLGRFACPTPGRVLVFLGEGGERAIVRRLRAIAAHKTVGLDQLAAEPGLRLCCRVPKLRDGGDLAELEAELGERPARLVILDPLYLAAAGQANGGNLYEMGAVLTPIQAICQHAGAALVVVTHWNKTGEGTDHKRISGAGPSAWGRVLASAAIAYRGTTPEGASQVVLAFQLVGGEIPDTRFRVRRTVRAHDPTDLASPLDYTAEVLPDDDPAADQGEVPLGADGQPLKPSRRWVLTALEAGGAMQTVKALGDHLAAQGHPLKPRTIQEALADLEAAGLAEGTEPAQGLSRYWSPAGSPRADALDPEAQP
jgi:AAA domain